MNCLQFYDAITRKEYIGNPERAEELYKAAGNMITEALQGKSVKDMPSDVFGGIIFKYWNTMGLSFEQCGNMLKYVGYGFKDKLRREFDEEYVEYGYLSIEDGGRGEEF